MAKLEAHSGESVPPDVSRPTENLIEFGKSFEKNIVFCNYRHCSYLTLGLEEKNLCRNRECAIKKQLHFKI